MKLLIVLSSLFLLDQSSPNLLIIDRELKRPLQQSTEFTPQQYMQKAFPIYASDLDAVSNAANEMAKLIDRGVTCYTADTIQTPHSVFLINIDCDIHQNITVKLQTFIHETATAYSFSLITNEESPRKAQQKLLDFANYLLQ